jgi:hypothetical protein
MDEDVSLGVTVTRKILMDVTTSMINANANQVGQVNVCSIRLANSQTER